VYQEDKARLSISGWYHTDAPPAGSEHASLKALTSQPGENAAAGDSKDFESRPCEPFTDRPDLLTVPLAGEAVELSEADLAALAEWINPQYLKAEALDAIHAKFVEDSAVQLHHFIQKDKFSEIQTALNAADAADGVGDGRVPAYKAGFGNGWDAIGPPHKQRFMRYDRAAAAASGAGGSGAGGGSGSESGRLLGLLQGGLVEANSFARFLQKITGGAISAR
jgi:hypothetical protein